VVLAHAAPDVLQDALQQMPLQRLQLRCYFMRWEGLDFRQLTRLTELQLRVPFIDVSGDYCDIELPSQLRILHVKGHGINVPGATAPEWKYALRRSPFVPVFANLTSLQQLQAFSSSTSLQLPQPLLQHLSQLASLQDVSLAYASVQAAACNGQDWVKLKQLQRLSIMWADSFTANRARPVDRAVLTGVLQSVGAVTTLTSLRVSFVVGGLVARCVAKGDACRLLLHAGLGAEQLPGKVQGGVLTSKPVIAVLTDTVACLRACLPMLQLNISMPPPSYWLQHSQLEGPESVPQLGDSAMPLPLDVFSHLTKLMVCQELQVTLGPLPRDPAYGVLTAGHVVQVLGGSAKQLSGELERGGGLRS
jgi:hypothetical protein